MRAAGRPRRAGASAGAGVMRLQERRGERPPPGSGPTRYARAAILSKSNSKVRSLSTW
jgi:hypothetical protein